MQMVQEASEEDEKMRKKDKTNMTDFIDYLNTDSGKLLIKMISDSSKLNNTIKDSKKSDNV